MADLPSNMRATLIGGSSACPNPAELLPGLAVGDVRALNADLDAASEGQQPLPPHRGLRRSCGMGAAALPRHMPKQWPFRGSELVRTLTTLGCAYASRGAPMLFFKL